MTLKILSKSKIAHKKTAIIIKNGGIAIIPTETVYGFAVNAFDIEAIKKVYDIKNRNCNKPLIVMASNIESLKTIVRIPHGALKIIQKFWPGQLTLIFPTTEIGQILSGGKKSLGVRIPNNKFVLKLLKELNIPIFTTSVNISNNISAKNLKETSRFNNIVDVMVDGGQCKFSFESTIIDMVKFPYVIVRKGCLDINKILKYIAY
ncbi:MAG: threonylcarbamoyl-AMP synthase [Endomicrobium sp.]|jgi:L-threonylcarbamoyladenylate synthase|nr:threonylcarbamoyl-AMP synthase [Endomicrobium sp.]